MKDEFINKLIKSEALSSLTIENKIQKTLNKYKWDTIRSPYYVDSTTKKDRELDLIARQFYKKKIKNGVEIIEEIVLLVECKSISGYHIIADGHLKIGGFDSELNSEIWVGYDLNRRAEIFKQILSKAKLSDAQIQYLIELISHLAYPNETSIFKGYVPRPLEMPDRFSSFRETNIGNVKDLDNSVLWKSFMALNSASESYDQFNWDRIEESLLFAVDEFLKVDNESKTFIQSYFTRDVFRHMSLHKILAVDANIWKNDRKLTPIPYFRFMQRNLYGHLDQWVDVVSLNSFDDYITLLSHHYNLFFKATKMKRFL